MFLQKVIIRKNNFLNYFFVGVLKVNDENSRIRIQIWIHIGSADPDSHQNVMDPKHCLHILSFRVVG
jgi:hypothetical protein